MPGRESRRVEPRSMGSPIIVDSTPAGARKSNATILRSNPAYVEEPLLLTIKQAVRRMGVKDGQVRKLTREGHLAHVKIGSRVMIPRRAIEQFIADNTVQPCRGEIPAPAFGFSKSADAFTSAGLNQAAAGSAALALQIANKPKSRSPSSFTHESGKAAPETYRKSS
jgi:excisionase family DNA binding protein